jgi:hypothetical protein
MRISFLVLTPLMAFQPEPARKKQKTTAGPLRVPNSNAEAVAYYTSPNWADFDQRGHPRSAPALGLWDRTEESVNGKPFRLALPAIASYPKTIVYRISSSHGLVIKYHAYCKVVEDPVESTLRESYFMELVHSHFPDMTTRLVYFSAALTPAATSVWKLKFLKCQHGDQAVPIVRYMISERVGETMYGLMVRFNRIPFAEAIAYGIELVGLLERLHSIRVVHGDIHASNVAFRQNKLVLIDFGRGMVGPSPNRVYEDIKPTNENILCHGTYTMWETINSLPMISFRDDVYRAMLMLAAMIHGDQHRDVQSKMCGNPPIAENVMRYYKIKARSNFFDTTMLNAVGQEFDFRIGSVLPRVNDVDAQELIAYCLGEILVHIRGLKYAQVPNYKFIRRTFEAVQDILAKNTD